MKEELAHLIKTYRRVMVNGLVFSVTYAGDAYCRVDNRDAIIYYMDVTGYRIVYDGIVRLLGRYL